MHGRAVGVPRSVELTVGGPGQLTFACPGGHRLHHDGAGPRVGAGLETRCPECGDEGEWARSPGGYEILSLLGRGGMGSVFEARDRGGRIVALKMLHPHRLSDPEVRQRFFTEAEAMAKVDHPNVVRLLDMGSDPTAPFLALEHADAGDLRSRLTGGRRLEPLEAAAIVEQAALAVQAAHARGIIHRDLKPGNLLLTRSGQVKVTDFGLARIVDSGRRRVTKSGAILGTPKYMSPEQIRDARSIGPSTDIYSLGAILFRALAGRSVFSAGDDINVLAQIMYELPPSLTELVPGLPDALEAVCLHCLEKAPERRYPTTADLAEDLGRLRRGDRPRASLEVRGRGLQHAVMTAPPPSPGDDASPGGPRPFATNDSVPQETPIWDHGAAAIRTGIELLRGLEAEQVRSLLGSGAIYRYPARGKVYSEGDPATHLFFVLAGQIEVYRRHDGARRRLAVLGPQQVFGELGLLHYGGTRTESARALIATEAMGIPGDLGRLVALFGGPATSLVVLRNLIGIIRQRLVARTRMLEGDGSEVGARRYRIDPHGALMGLDRAVEPAIMERLRREGIASPGQFLFHHGDEADGLYFLRTGTLEVLDESTPGVPRRLATLSAPSIVGELGFFTGQERLAGLRATTEVHYTRYARTEFDRLRESDPDSALKIMLAGVQLSLLLLLEWDR